MVARLLFSSDVGVPRVPYFEAWRWGGGGRSKTANRTDLDCLAGTMVWSVSQSIGEMAIMYPLPSAYVQWTNKFIDPAAGFALGWCYWFCWWISIANELAGLVTVLGFWSGTSKITTAGWIAIFLLVVVAVNICAVNYFAETEVVLAAIKFGWIFVVIMYVFKLKFCPDCLVEAPHNSRETALYFHLNVAGKLQTCANS